MYSLGEESHFKLEMREKMKGIFGNSAQSEYLPVQKILSLPEQSLSLIRLGNLTKDRKKKKIKMNQGKTPWKKSEVGYCSIIAWKSQKCSSHVSKCRWLKRILKKMKD